MKKASLSLLAVLACMSPASGVTTQTADFTGAEPPAGWTVANGEYRSPEYAGAVDKIVLRYAGSDASASATVHAFPENEEGVSVATFTAASSGASFDFPESTAFRSFRIAAANGLALSSFTAYVASDSLDVPSGVSISNNVTGTSFDAAWNAVEGATGYRRTPPRRTRRSTSRTNSRMTALQVGNTAKPTPRFPTGPSESARHPTRVTSSRRR